MENDILDNLQFMDVFEKFVSEKVNVWIYIIFILKKCKYDFSTTLFFFWKYY